MSNLAQHLIDTGAEHADRRARLVRHLWLRRAVEVPEQVGRR